MHDPMAWSIPLGRLFGIVLRVHLLFPFVALGQVLHAQFYKPYPEYVPIPYTWLDVLILMLLLFVSVLWHELGHCFAARSVGGEANEILMWPLGGLANVEVPNQPRAHLITAAAGPAFNLLLCLVAAVLLLALADRPLQPPWNPLPGGYPFRHAEGLVTLTTYGGGTLELDPVRSPAVWVARLFWVNWFLALLNIVLVGFPLDGGRMLQAALWPSMGYHHSMQTAVFAGFVVVFVVGLYALVFSSVLALALALFIYFACQRQWILLETGGEEGVFGYDFSQGYTSLERDRDREAAPAKPRLSWWQRWMQRRAARRLAREQEQRAAEEKRLDELLDKINREGRASLTEEEARFLKRVSDRYRSGH
jgi:stage IV sporulation protein FB